MGVFRLILSYAVVGHHVGIAVGSFFPGVMAVVGFLMLSGYLMTALIDRYYGSLRLAGSFYVDRAARIYPQFVFYLCVTVLLARAQWIQSDLLAECPTSRSVFANLSILPLGLGYPGLEHCLPIPQAWSLALEVSFYLSVPFILVLRLQHVAVALSLGVFALAYLGILHTDWFGYRTLPGTLFIFLCGSYFYSWRPGERWTLIAIAAVAFVALVGTFLFPQLDVPYNRSVLAGIALGIPMVWFVRRLPPTATDLFAGNLAYGVFLSHFVFIWLLPAALSASLWGRFAFVTVAATLAAYVSYQLVERPAIRFRHALRLAMKSRRGQASRLVQSERA